MKNKRGQAFLVGAILLVGILIGLVATNNYLQTSGFSTLNYEGERINIESKKVMDYALLNKGQNEKLNSTAINKFTKEVTNSTGPNTDTYFIENSSYSGNSGPIDCYKWNKTRKKEYCKTQIKNQKIISTITGTNYTFPKTQGKHFYFIMIKEDESEKYVYKNS